MFTGQLRGEPLEWLHRPTIAYGYEELFPGVKKQWGLGMILLPEGFHTGRGRNTGSWAGSYSRKWPVICSLTLFSSGFPNTHWVADHENGLLVCGFARLLRGLG